MRSSAYVWQECFGQWETMKRPRVIAAVLLSILVIAPASGAVSGPFDGPAVAVPQGRIDELVFGRLQHLGVQPAHLCSDAVFVRRACLDVIGTLPAEDMMQAFFYRHLVPAQELKVAISGRWMAKGQVRILSHTPVRIAAGGAARVRVSARAIALAGRVELELSEPPEGITIEKVMPSRDGADIVLQADAAKTKPGLKGNLIIHVFAVNPPIPAQKTPPANRPRVPVNTLPAIPFEITGLD